jgi:Terminase large subunit, T4likevirus-type, N-terminal/Caudovirus prohead serine protease
LPLATECEPRYATARTAERRTLGGAAAKVAKVLGQPLMPWQRRVADVALEVDTAGRLIFRDVVLTVPRQQGKSFLILVLLLVRALLTPRTNAVYTAQSGLDARKKLAEDWWPAVQASAIGSQVTAYLAPGRESLRLSNGSVVQLVASTAKAGHGMSVDLGVMDEAFAYQDARTEQALRPAMMTRPDPQLLVVSTAGTPDASPYLHDRVQGGRLAVEAGVTEGLCYFEWSAGDDAEPADPDTWRSCMPALGHTVSEDTVAAAHRSIGRSEFARAYLNRWVASMGDPIIDLEAWNALAEPDAPRPAEVILGVDVAPSSRSAAIACAGPHAGCLRGCVLEHGPGTAWVAGRLTELQEQLGAEVAADRKACAAIWPEIEPLGPVEIDARQAAEATAYFIDLVSRQRFRHRGERELTVAIDGAALRPLADAHAWGRKAPRNAVFEFTLALFPRTLRRQPGGLGERGDGSECSFAFRATGQEWNEDKTRRTLTEISVHRGDVSLVTAGANPHTSVGVRAEDLSLEQRDRMVERVGRRVCGPSLFTFEDSSTLTVARAAAPRPRSYIEQVKLRRARLLGGEHRADDGPRYTEKEIEALGKEGLALKKKSGRGFHYPIKDRRDLFDAISAYGRAVPSERDAVRRWIVKRAIILRLMNLLPDAWVPKAAA